MTKIMLKTKEDYKLYFIVALKILVFLEILASALVFFGNIFSETHLSFDKSIDLLIRLFICWIIAIFVLPVLFWWIGE